MPTPSRVLVTLTAAVLAVTGCRPDESKSKQNKPTEDSEKPTDNSEGVPGYLTDPEMIAIQSAAPQKFTIDGPAGAVAGGTDKPEDQKIQVFIIDRKVFTTLDKAADGTYTVSAAATVTTAVGTDGSFQAELTSEGGGFPIVVLQVTKDPEVAAFTVKKGQEHSSLAYATLADGARFAALDSQGVERQWSLSPSCPGNTPIFDATTAHWTGRNPMATARYNHGAAWTGKKLFIHGGHAAESLAHGELVGLDDNIRAVTNPAGDPGHRGGAAVIRGGDRVMVWGGMSGNKSVSLTAAGAVYDPATDSWKAMSPADTVPSSSHAGAVWTGDRLFVWGGQTWKDGADVPVSSGGLYSPDSDTWTPTPAAGAPEADASPAAVAIAGEVAVFTGKGGALLNPATVTWRPMSQTGAPAFRRGQKAAANDRFAFVWGGVDQDQPEIYPNTGSIYDPVADAWQAVSTAGAPEGRVDHTLVHTGRYVLVWGGARTVDGIEIRLNDGGIYDTCLKQWHPLPAAGAPGVRRLHSATWTGRSMVIAGGYNSLTNYLDSVHEFFLNAEEPSLSGGSSGDTPFVQ